MLKKLYLEVSQIGMYTKGFDFEVQRWKYDGILTIC